MEIERKFLVKTLPSSFENYRLRLIEQGYLSTIPAIRVRRDNNNYYLTYKSGGAGMSHEEANLPLTEKSYLHLLEKADGYVITKKRYEIPYGIHTIELDIFENELEGLIIAEVEFTSEEEALSFTPPEWFGDDVTDDTKYTNSDLSISGKIPQ